MLRAYIIEAPALTITLQPYSLQLANQTMSNTTESPAKEPRAPSRVIPVLNLLVNIVKAGLLVGVVVLLSRIDATLKDTVRVSIPQGFSDAIQVKTMTSTRLDVRLADANGYELGVRENPLRVSDGS